MNCTPFTRGAPRNKRGRGGIQGEKGCHQRPRESSVFMVLEFALLVAGAKKGKGGKSGKKCGKQQKSGFAWASSFSLKPYEASTLRSLCEAAVQMHMSRTGKPLHASLMNSPDVPKALWNAPTALVIVGEDPAFSQEQIEDQDTSASDEDAQQSKPEPKPNAQQSEPKMKTGKGKPVVTGKPVVAGKPVAVEKTPVEASPPPPPPAPSGPMVFLYANVAALEAFGIGEQDSGKLIGTPSTLPGTMGDPSKKFQSDYSKKIKSEDGESWTMNAKRWIIEQMGMLNGLLVMNPIGIAYAWDTWILEDGTTCNAGGVRTPRELSLEEVIKLLEDQAALVRQLKMPKEEGGQGLANKSPEVAAAVKELLRLKEKHADLEAEQGGARKEACESRQPDSEDDEGQRRRLQQSLSLRAPSHPSSAPYPAVEQAWYQDWGQRLECWWVAYPHQSALQACVGALSLRLALRFEAAMRLAGKAPPQGNRAVPEQSCDWVRDEQLQLPEFPSLDGFQFTLPPIPRLLPSWELLQTADFLQSQNDLLSLERSVGHEKLPFETQQANDNHSRGSMAYVAAGAGMGAVAGAMTVLLIARSARRSSARSGVKALGTHTSKARNAMSGGIAHSSSFSS